MPRSLAKARAGAPSRSEMTATTRALQVPASIACTIARRLPPRPETRTTTSIVRSSAEPHARTVHVCHGASHALHGLASIADRLGGARFGFGRHHGHEPEAHVEGAVHLGLVGARGVLDEVEDGLTLPRAGVELKRDALGQHARQV